MKTAELFALIAALAEKNPEACFELPGSTQKGYGRVSLRDCDLFPPGRRAAHRVVYRLLVGPIPAGLDLDHLCRNRRCVNPRHLEPVTRAVNLRRGETGKWKRTPRTHCRRGHFYTPETTLDHGGGKRQCRVCLREWYRQRYQREKEQAERQSA